MCTRKEQSSSGGIKTLINVPGEKRSAKLTGLVILKLKLGPSGSQQRGPVFEKAGDVKVVETQAIVGLFGGHLTALYEGQAEQSC